MSVMKIFFDTEFTGLHKNTTLISIGLVDENDRTFYAEFSDYDESQCDEWIHENVINHLKWSKEGPIENFENISENTSFSKADIINNKVKNFANIYVDDWEAYGTKEYIKTVLTDWLSTYDSVELVSDCCHYDMVLFIDIFGGAFDIPKNVNPACHDINQDIAKYYKITEREAFDLSREGIVEIYNELVKPWPNRVINIEGDKHNALYDAKVIKVINKIANG